MLTTACLSDADAKMLGMRDPEGDEEARIDATIAAMKEQLRRDEMQRLLDIKGGYGKRDYEPKSPGSRVMRRGGNLRDA